ncbi:MAG: septum formation protein Maf [Chloroflexi bacterium]|nr:septum formation protein Maf [Chloroflexota bacterium]
MVPQILLASGSPRRRQILAWSGWSFDVAPVGIDETPYPEERPESYVLRLAETKARAAAALVAPGVLILAADTTVADGIDILGKPADARQAADMLARLRGRTHQVYTALALFSPQQERLVTDLCGTDVHMRAYNQAELEAYVASGDPLDKAGAYAIQHAGFHPVEDFRGCYACVMGLPLCNLARLAAKLGLNPALDAPLVCQGNLRYDCPVFQAVRPDFRPDEHLAACQEENNK